MRGGVLGLLVMAAPAAAEPLTYDEAMRMASQRNPSVLAARDAVESAEESVRGSLGTWDPTLTLNGGYDLNLSSRVQQEFQTLFFTDAEAWNANLSVAAQAPSGTSGTVTFGVVRTKLAQDFTVYGNPAQNPSDFFSTESVVTTVPTVRLALSQELLRGLLIRFNNRSVRQAREQLAIAELEAEQTRQQALADVARSYWTWVYQDQLARIRQDAVATAEEALRVGREKVATGQLAPVERTRLEAAYVQAQSAAIQASNAAAQAGDGLLLLLGEAPASEVEPGSGPGDVPDLAYDAEEAVKVALDQSLSLRIQEQRAANARLALLDAKHAAWPSLTADLTGNFSGQVPDGVTGVGLTDLVRPSVGIGATFSVPLGNRAARGNREAAEVEARRQARLVQDARARLVADVRQQVRVLNAARTQMELADINLRLARETLAAEEALQDAGRRLLKDVLEARDAVEQAEGEAVRARTDHRLALVELDRLLSQLGGG